MEKVDVCFRLSGDRIPADHGYHLFSAVSGLVPELHGDDEVGLHPIRGHLLGSRDMLVDDRSFLSIRLPGERIAQVLPLAGKRLQINGSSVRVGVPHTRPLIPAARLYSRLVVIKGFLEPEPFLEAARRQLADLDIHGEASLVFQPQWAAANAGQPHGTHSPYLRRTIRIRHKEIVGFALSVQDLTAEESIRLQERGIGGRRRFGCGIFVPDNR